LPVKIALAVLLTVFLAAPAAAAPPHRFRQEVNETRDCAQRLRAAPLQLRSARQHSREMAAADELFHTDLTGAKVLTGEAIGSGPTWRSIFWALLESPDHHDLLMDCRYDRMAVGFYFGRSVWLTARLYDR
jgi:uncharacterized protein YkwD